MEVRGGGGVVRKEWSEWGNKSEREKIIRKKVNERERGGDGGKDFKSVR